MRPGPNALHWQAVIDHVKQFHHLLGKNLDHLSLPDRQTVAQCLIQKVIVTGEQVDIYMSSLLCSAYHTWAFHATATGNHFKQPLSLMG